MKLHQWCKEKGKEKTVISKFLFSFFFLTWKKNVWHRESERMKKKGGGWNSWRLSVAHSFVKLRPFRPSSISYSSVRCSWEFPRCLSACLSAKKGNRPLRPSRCKIEIRIPIVSSDSLISITFKTVLRFSTILHWVSGKEMSSFIFVSSSGCFGILWRFLWD